MTQQCEWCERPAVVKLMTPKNPGYTRYSCGDDEHNWKTMRLVKLDNGSDAAVDWFLLGELA